MAVEAVGIHVAIAHGGQCLDAEEEGIQERAARHAGNAGRAGEVEAGENKINGEVNAKHDAVNCGQVRVRSQW